MAAEDQRVFAEEVRDSSENRRKEQEDSRQTAEAAHRAAEEIRSALMSDVPPCLNSARSQREMSETRCRQGQAAALMGKLWIFAGRSHK